jgi:hypothetical protein
VTGPQWAAIIAPLIPAVGALILAAAAHLKASAAKNAAIQAASTAGKAQDTAGAAHAVAVAASDAVAGHEVAHRSIDARLAEAAADVAKTALEDMAKTARPAAARRTGKP